MWSYFVIPFITVSVSVIKNIFYMQGEQWLFSLIHPTYLTPMWLHRIFWQIVLMYTTIGIVALWNNRPRPDTFGQMITLLVGNGVAVILGYYFLFVMHNMMVALACLIYIAVSIWYIIVQLHAHYRYISLLFVPYGLLSLVAIANLLGLMMAN